MALLDPLLHMRKKANKGEMLYGRVDFHLNSNGHHAIAEYLLPTIEAALKRGPSVRLIAAGNLESKKGMGRLAGGDSSMESTFVPFSKPPYACFQAIECDRPATVPTRPELKSAMLHNPGLCQ
jgi:hypothetical protein